MKYFLVILILGLSFNTLKAEYKIWGGLKNSVINYDINKSSYSSKSQTKTIGVNNSYIGIKGFKKANNTIYLYRFELDFEKIGGMPSLVNAKTFYVGNLSKLGVLAFGNFTSVSKRASAFLDNWNAAMINPFYASLGYVPNLSVNNTEVGKDSLLKIYENTLSYVSPKFNNFDFAFRISEKYNYNGLKTSYDTEAIKIGFSHSKNTTKNKKTLIDLLALQYKYKNYLFGLSFNQGIKTQKDFRGSYIDLIYNYKKYAFHLGIGNFKFDKKNNNANAFELTYQYSKKIKLFSSLANYKFDNSNSTDLDTRIISMGLLVEL